MALRPRSPLKPSGRPADPAVFFGYSLSFKCLLLLLLFLPSSSPQISESRRRRRRRVILDHGGSLRSAQRVKPQQSRRPSQKRRPSAIVSLQHFASAGTDPVVHPDHPPPKKASEDEDALVEFPRDDHEPSAVQERRKRNVHGDTDAAPRRNKKR